MTENFYRVLASTKTRDPYPVYRFYREPSDWHCNGTVKVSCKDGRVNFKIFEKDSINVHHLEVYADGPVTARLTEQTSHPDRP